MGTHISDGVYRQIVEGAGDGVIFADREGKIVLWNRGAENIFGFAEDEAVGQSLDIIIPDNLRGRHWEGYMKTMETGETRYGDTLLAVPALSRNGERLSIEFTVVMVLGEEGKPEGVAAIVRDVTERWLKERELKKRLAEYEGKK